MSACDETRARLALGEASAADDRHLATCAECRAAAGGLRSLARTLAEATPAGAPPGLLARALERAEPELRRNAIRWRRSRALRAARLCAAPAAAALLLPAVLAIDLWLVRSLRALAEAALPALVGDYLTLSYALFLTALLAATYASLPFFVARQCGAGGARGDAHA